ncbi:MAG: S24/S26 family peptidase [Clostridia bacterium]|nr:S24/S26 family peptidase [Clostridia bacterium]
MKQISLPLKDMYPLIAETLNSGGEVYITVRGNSMAPFLRDGRDQAVFAPLAGRRLRRGDIVFYQRASGQFVMHRIYAVAADGMMTMLGDAQWMLEPGIRPEQLRALVPRVVRKGREVSCEKGLLHRLMTLYLLRIRFPRLARLCKRILHIPAAVRRRIRRK